MLSTSCKCTSMGDDETPPAFDMDTAQTYRGTRSTCAVVRCTYVKRYAQSGTQPTKHRAVFVSAHLWKCSTAGKISRSVCVS